MIRTPMGWQDVLLEEICEITSSKRVLQEQWQKQGIPFFRAREIVKLDKDGYVENELFISEALFDDYRNKYGVPEAGDLMVSAVGTLGACYVVKESDRFYFKDASVLRLRPRNSIDVQFIKYALKSPAILEQINASSGSTVGTYTISRAQQTKLQLPPFAEQKRIVAKLDALMARSTRAREELAHIPRLIERYKQAVLAAAFSGKLTADWREKHPHKTAELLQEYLRESINEAQAKRGLKSSQSMSIGWLPAIDKPSEWLWVSVDQIASLVQYGSSAKTSEALVNGVPVIRMGNIVDGHLDYKNLKFLPTGHPEFPAMLLQEGDLLFNRTNSAELVGKTAVYQGEQKPASFASYLIRVQVCSYIPELLSAYINSPFGREWVASVVNQQVGQANVNGTKLKALGVPYMHPEEQETLWHRIRNAFTAIEAISAEMSKSQLLCSHLEQATLAKAFRGELVPQDPHDEPASVLLERIRAERSEQPIKGRKKAMAKV